MTVKKLAQIAVISALAYLIMLVFKIPVSFLSYELKDVVITLGGFILGGAYYIYVILFVCIIELITMGSSGIIGFITNFISSILYIAPICILYQKGKPLWKGILFGTILMALGMFITNIIVTPIYLGASLEETIQLLFTTVTPFNLVKGILNGIIIYILYKPLIKAVKKANLV